jgi:chromosome segregation ATPase
MKVFWSVLAVLVLAAVGLLIWRAPGCRQRAAQVYEEYGGWTQEARQADPVGFIEYAEQQLNEHLDRLSETRRRLAEAESSLADSLEHNAQLREKAAELADAFRAAYREAEAGGGYPVEVRGAEYTREELLEQVRLILLQRRNYEDVIEDLRETRTLAQARREQLAAQVSSTRAALSTLPSKKEIARVNQLTNRTEELLGQVNELIGENEEVLQESPVRTVEQLAETEPAGEPEDVDVQAFLEAGR